MGEALDNLAMTREAGPTGWILSRQIASSPRFSVLGGGFWDLATRTPERFTMVVPDRDFHCPFYQTMPFARSSFSEALQAFDLFECSDYPAKGEA